MKIYKRKGENYEKMDGSHRVDRGGGGLDLHRALRAEKIKKVLVWMVVLGLLLSGTGLWVSEYVRREGEMNLLSAAEAEKLQEVDCILVLGCYVNPTGTPSPLLAERLAQGVELYQAGVAPKLLMSGDHGRKEYNEVAGMKRYAVQAGVDPEDIFLDHAGFSTYESIVRAKEIFGAKKIVIVTQKYHLSRALYLAREMGLEAKGVACDRSVLAGQAKRDAREVLARGKDYFFALLRPMPTYLGEKISLKGSGLVTEEGDA